MVMGFGLGGVRFCVGWGPSSDVRPSYLHIHPNPTRTHLFAPPAAAWPASSCRCWSKAWPRALACFTSAATSVPSSACFRRMTASSFLRCFSSSIRRFAVASCSSSSSLNGHELGMLAAFLRCPMPSGGRPSLALFRCLVVVCGV